MPEVTAGYVLQTSATIHSSRSRVRPAASTRTA